LLATEIGRGDVARDRQTWRNHRQPRMRQEADRLVFLDETATTTKMTRLRGRARRGQRLKAQAPFGHWETQTFIAALRCDGLTASWIIAGAMNRTLFETYVETQLAPTLRPGDIVIFDNLSSPTTPTSIRSKWPLPNSRLISGGSEHEPSRNSGKPLAPSAASTAMTSARTTSNTPVMPQIKSSML
jgi:hypothetical protein